MENLLNENDPKNTLVHVVMHTQDNEDYELAGVLIRDEEDSIRVAFNAKNDQPKDYLDIKKSEIVKIDIVDPAEIEKL